MTTTNKKTFDAVGMKNQIQPEIIANDGNGSKTSNDPLAIVWREMLNKRPRNENAK